MPDLIGLDFETYGAEDLPTHGLARYVRHKTFQPLIASVSTIDSREVYGEETCDFISDRAGSVLWLRDQIADSLVVAHNAPFEQATLDWLGIELPSDRFVDSAVVARAAGAASALEAAAPQLLDTNKLDSGKALINLFSKPGKYQEENGSKVFDPQIIADHPDQWAEFIHYCEVDARCGLQIAHTYRAWLPQHEHLYQAVTMDMNRAGWCVDRELVEEMLRRSEDNKAEAVENFRQSALAPDLNLNSHKQLKEWCAERGIKAASFDEKNVAKLLGRLNEKLEVMAMTDPKRLGYEEVRLLLETKQIVGGSSLKKLPVILNTAVDMGDGTHRLFDQYLHIGAGQTYRTTGRSAQMQNLKRLGENPDNVVQLEQLQIHWDNEKLARNIRQCFCATHPQGRLLVGDFSSVESRGLAYLAGADWKLQAFCDGKDMYKVLAEQMFHVHYDDVLKPQRQAGKVGELSCGYGAGPGAVKDFAEGMGIIMTEGEATTLVYDWRNTNPEVVALWAQLDQMLHDVIEGGSDTERHQMPYDGLMLTVARSYTPPSLKRQHPSAQSICVMVSQNNRVILRRYFHGCYMRGRDVCYYKPSDRKTGDLWRSHFIHPKTKQLTFYKIYGGKLAGILTQSFCRELFFHVLLRMRDDFKSWENVDLVGQFHDEIVVDWKPAQRSRTTLDLDQTKRDMSIMMSDPGPYRAFPLAAEIKDDFRYTK